MSKDLVKQINELQKALEEHEQYIAELGNLTDAWVIDHKAYRDKFDPEGEILGFFAIWQSKKDKPVWATHFEEQDWKLNQDVWHEVVAYLTIEKGRAICEKPQMGMYYGYPGEQAGRIAGLLKQVFTRARTTRKKVGDVILSGQPNFAQLLEDKMGKDYPGITIDGLIDHLENIGQLPGTPTQRSFDTLLLKSEIERRKTG